MRMIPSLLLAAATACISGAAIAAPAEKPVYEQLAVTPVPDMPEGDWDQLVTDVAHNRIYVSGEDGALMAAFNLETGALIASGGDVVSPHKVAFDPKTGHLLVAEGKDGTVKVLTTDFKTVASIPVGAKSDTGAIDLVGRVFYVSGRDGDTGSQISAISLDTLKVVRRFPVPAMTLKGLVLDRAGGRLFVSMRDKNAVGVIDIRTGTLRTWTSPNLNKNVPLAYDKRSQRLFAGSREPGRLVVLDARSGKELQSLPGTETADSMSFDEKGRILYVSGDTGMSRYRIAANGNATLLETDASLVGKSSLYVGENHRLYVMRPRKGETVAALQVYAVHD
jgi:hypothetical protein